MASVPKPEALAGRGGCWFSVPGIDLHIGVDNDFRPARKAHVAIVVTDLESARVVLLEAGVAVTEDDVDVGVRRFYADDPFGNHLEFVAAG